LNLRCCWPPGSERHSGAITLDPIKKWVVHEGGNRIDDHLLAAGLPYQFMETFEGLFLIGT
jgi:hypothetical protein